MNNSPPSHSPHPPGLTLSVVSHIENNSLFNFNNLILMRSCFKFYLIISFLTLISYSCKLTRTDIVGKWIFPQNDTLIINKDNSFLLIRNSSNRDINQNDKFVYSNLATGQWMLNNKSVYFSFSDTSQNFGGKCSTFQYWTRLTKKKLIRPVNCETSTHRFVVINKIE